MVLQKTTRNIFLSYVFLFYSCMSATETADLIIFSYNRPLQLYALLESVYRYITDLEDVYVIYRFDNAAYYESYQKVSRYFPQVTFKAQGSYPHADFKSLTVQTTFESPHDYVIFAVDDIIVKDSINLTECINALNETQAYGFYFRLGTNLSQGYPTGHLPLPPLSQVKPQIYSWSFSQGYDY